VIRDKILRKHSLDPLSCPTTTKEKLTINPSFSLVVVIGQEMGEREWDLIFRALKTTRKRFALKLRSAPHKTSK
jgi:hypothetical protein